MSGGGRLKVPGNEVVEGCTALLHLLLLPVAVSGTLSKDALSI